MKVRILVSCADVGCLDGALSESNSSVRSRGAGPSLNPHQLW